MIIIIKENTMQGKDEDINSFFFPISPIKTKYRNKIYMIFNEKLIKSETKTIFRVPISWHNVLNKAKFKGSAEP